MRDRAVEVSPSLVKVAFLDRDGTVNVDRGYVHRREDWVLCPGVCEGIALLRESGFLVAIVSNQAGIGKKLFGAEDVERLHGHMGDELSVCGGIDAIAYCPHASEDRCDCRKPQTGMLRRIEKQLPSPIDFTGSWMVGDKPSDILFGERLGVHTALIRSRYWRGEDLRVRPDLVVDSLLDAANRIVTT